MDYPFFDFLTSPASEKAVWVDLLEIIIPLGLGIWGFVRAYSAWERQKKREIDLLLDKQRYERKLAACQATWPLLAYMSMWENEQSVFVKRGKTWHFRPRQIRDYLKALPEIFFAQGHGVFMPAEARDGLYHFRGTVYKMLDRAHKEGQQDAEEIPLDNQAIVDETVPQIYKAIHSSLREMLKDSNIAFDEKPA